MTSGNVVMYYDDECDFCRRWVYLVRRWLCLPKSRLVAGRSDSTIWEEMMLHNSWIVSDASGAHHYSFDAMATLLAASPIFFPLAPIARISFIAKLGERYYRYVASHRRWV